MEWSGEHSACLVRCKFCITKIERKTLLEVTMINPIHFWVKYQENTSARKIIYEVANVKLSLE
jgi:hypothetical protein